MLYPKADFFRHRWWVRQVWLSICQQKDNSVTSKEVFKTDTSECWPASDFYFHTGVSALSEKLKKNVKSQGFFFINLNRYTLRAFMREFSGITHSGIVIICSKPLLPLAHFWLKEGCCVRAVFESNVSVDSVARELNNLKPEGKMTPPFRPSFRKLTHQDLFLLRNYIEQSEVMSLQLKFSCSRSTIYRWKMMIARKFGVRKIECLFS